MSKRLEISTQQVRAEAGRLRDEAASFLQTSQQMFEDGRALDRCWEGDASEKFAQRMRNDEPRFNQLYEIVQQYCEEIELSARDYELLDAQATQAIQGNTIRQSK